MSPVPLRDRVVEVISDLGPAADNRYRYGSGCLVRGRTVLTAAHVVAGADSVVVRNPDKRKYKAKVLLVGDVDGPGPDLALLMIDDPKFDGDLPAIGLAAVNRDSAVGEQVEGPTRSVTRGSPTPSLSPRCGTLSMRSELSRCYRDLRRDC